MSAPSRRPTVSECRLELRSAPVDSLPSLIRRHADDERVGVRHAVRAASRRLERDRAERRRVAALYGLQTRLHEEGVAVVAGVDEVGRGALAGPVTAGAAVLAPGTHIHRLDDSKRLTPARREEVALLVRDLAIAVAVAHVAAVDIDRLGIVGATRRAMSVAVSALELDVERILVDGADPGPDDRCLPVIDGDARVAAIAAASVVAKVERDALMVSLDSQHPGYGLAEHKGYGTAEHLEAIASLGPSPVHRRSFAPCRKRPTLF